MPRTTPLPDWPDSRAGRTAQAARHGRDAGHRFSRRTLSIHDRRRNPCRHQMAARAGTKETRSPGDRTVIDAHYAIADTSQILSPGLVIFRDLVEQNLAEMIRVAGSADRLRPHCKTHKMREIVQMQLARGIIKHKCATIAEAEMLAEAGAKDIFLAYNPVGPNIHRVVQFATRFPAVRFAVTGDHPGPIAAVGDALASTAKSVEMLLDIDCGQ